MLHQRQGEAVKTSQLQEWESLEAMAHKQQCTRAKQARRQHGRLQPQMHLVQQGLVQHSPQHPQHPLAEALLPTGDVCASIRLLRRCSPVLLPALPIMVSRRTRGAKHRVTLPRLVLSLSSARSTSSSVIPTNRPLSGLPTIAIIAPAQRMALSTLFSSRHCWPVQHCSQLSKIKLRVAAAHVLRAKRFPILHGWSKVLPSS